MNQFIASESDSNREQVKTYIKYYILTSYKLMMQIYRITSNFRLFIPLVKASKTGDFQDRFFKKIVNRFTFKEIPKTGLGFSKRNTKGRGISGALSIQLAHSAYAIINAGIEDPEIFGLMQLIEDNMAADRISDMTIAILQKHFLEYTQRISKEMGLKT